VEGAWKGRVTADALRETAADLRRSNWQQLADAGVHEMPTGDFSYYDHVLDTSVMVGAVPQRHREAVTADALDGYFAMARGTQDVAPLEMTKWFDTNYHYLVPELGPDTVFTADSAKQVTELKEALALGHTARPVLVGPVTYLLLAKPAPGVAADFEPLTLLDRLLPVYAEVLADLRAVGAEWVQLDEPALVQDRSSAELSAATRTYRELGDLTDRPKLLVASYFDRLGEALPVLAKAPVEGLALDFTDAAAANLEALAAAGGLPGKRLVAGVVNGRNIWINDYEKSLATLATLLGLADQIDVAASCSLLVPLDTTPERDIEPQVLRWLAFARQKTAEIVTLAKGLAHGTGAVSSEIAANRADLASRAHSPITHEPGVRARTAAITEPTAVAPSRTPSVSRPSVPTSNCRCCRRPPSARSRRPVSCVHARRPRVLPAPGRQRRMDLLGCVYRHPGRDPDRRTTRRGLRPHPAHARRGTGRARLDHGHLSTAASPRRHGQLSRGLRYGSPPPAGPSSCPGPPVGTV
jgi:5-methyltetrahydropteroyltriglutamate--homocysteine methyltransferase